MRRTENPENVVRVHECPLDYAGIAQMVERRSPKPNVVGSNPSACANKNGVSHSGYCRRLEFLEPYGEKISRLWTS